MSNVHRIPAPWENHSMHGTRIPLENHKWYMDANSGRPILCDCEWDTGTKTATVTHTPKGSPEPMDFDTVTQVFGVAREKDISIVEAYIEVVGEENLAQSWVDRALEGRLAKATILPEPRKPKSRSSKPLRKVRVTVPSDVSTPEE